MPRTTIKVQVSFQLKVSDTDSYYFTDRPAEIVCVKQKEVDEVISTLKKLSQVDSDIFRICAVAISRVSESTQQVFDSDRQENM